MEEWGDVPEYNGIYKVSNFGNVVSYSRGKRKLLKPRIINGYQHVDLYKNPKRTTFGVHQLVAMVYHGFKKNNKDGLCVNHKDFNRSNNYKDNLEVITIRENSSKRSVNTRNGLTCTRYNKNNNPYKSVIYYDKAKIILGVFETEIEAHECYLKALSDLEIGIKPKRYKPITKSDFVGVSYSEGKWVSYITINGVSINLGRYKTEQEAISARLSANEKVKNGEKVLSKSREKPNKLKGITFSLTTNKWLCSLKIGNRWVLIARFDDAKSAEVAQANAIERFGQGESIDTIRLSYKKPNKYKRYRPLIRKPFVL